MYYVMQGRENKSCLKKWKHEVKGGRRNQDSQGRRTMMWLCGFSQMEITEGRMVSEFQAKGAWFVLDR